ncbi:MAG: hypothetical protein LBT40_11835 [Deltaproteobacteria bacterium]|jgi:hypothetical protein|nr:hypothetical protein [Deltaproteobacteria bacterium]
MKDADRRKIWRVSVLALAVLGTVLIGIAGSRHQAGAPASGRRGPSGSWELGSASGAAGTGAASVQAPAPVETSVTPEDPGIPSREAPGPASPGDFALWEALAKSLPDDPLAARGPRGDRGAVLKDIAAASPLGWECSLELRECAGREYGQCRVRHGTRRQCGPIFGPVPGPAGNAGPEKSPADGRDGRLARGLH